MMKLDPALVTKFRNNWPYNDFIIRMVLETYPRDNCRYFNYKAGIKAAYDTVILFCKGHTYYEIAKAMGVTYNAVYLRLRKFFKYYKYLVQEVRTEIMANKHLLLQ